MIPLSKGRIIELKRKKKISTVVGKITTYHCKQYRNTIGLHDRRLNYRTEDTKNHKQMCRLIVIIINIKKHFSSVDDHNNHFEIKFLE